jgi:flagellar hook assembly protein FlgD
LKQNYPNPFNPETRIEYSVAVSEHVLLQIFNQRAQLIRTLVNEPQAPGSYMKIWDGKDESGNSVASGIYLYRLQAGKFSETKKMIKLQ